MVQDGGAGLQRHVLHAGVDQVGVLLAFSRQRPVANEAVLRLER